MTYCRDRTPNSFLYWSGCNENLWTHVKIEKNWSNHCVFFIVFFIENESFTENGKEAVCTPNLPSFPPPTHLSYIHTAALIFHRSVCNMFYASLEAQKLFLTLNFFGSTIPFKIITFTVHSWT